MYAYVENYNERVNFVRIFEDREDAIEDALTDAQANGMVETEEEMDALENHLLDCGYYVEGEYRVTIIKVE